MEHVMNKRPVIGVTCITTKGAHGNIVYPHPEPYCQAVHNYGGIPMTIPAFLKVEEVLRYLEIVDAMIFIGGPDIPSHRYNEEPLAEYCHFLAEEITDAHLALVKAVLASKMPFLGVCLGCQELNVGSGGRLIQHLFDLTPRHRNTYVDEEKNFRPDAYHFAELEEGSLLAELFGTTRVRVNSCHHQALNPDFIGEGFKVIARSTEDNVVEAIQRSDREFALGVQWHPERIDDEEHRKRIFDALIRAAANYRS